jgi:hypothetical protein
MRPQVSLTLLQPLDNLVAFHAPLCTIKAARFRRPNQALIVQPIYATEKFNLTL